MDFVFKVDDSQNNFFFFIFRCVFFVLGVLDKWEVGVGLYGKYVVQLDVCFKVGFCVLLMGLGRLLRFLSFRLFLSFGVVGGGFLFGIIQFILGISEVFSRCFGIRQVFKWLWYWVVGYFWGFKRENQDMCFEV